MVRKTAFSQDQALELGAVAQRVGFRPLFLPKVLAQPPLDAVAAGDVPFSDIVAGADSDISPTSDDRPFFYQFERGIPADLRPLLWVLAGVVLAGGVLLAVGQRQLTPARLRLSPLYFAALGAGFMMVEVAVIQQSRLFLGHPALAVATVLAVLLVGGGLGSGLAGRIFPRHAGSLPPGPSALVALLVILWTLVWPPLSHLALSAALPLRILLVAGSPAAPGIGHGHAFSFGSALRRPGRRWASRPGLGRQRGDDRGGIGRRHHPGHAGRVPLGAAGRRLPL